MTEKRVVITGMGTVTSIGKNINEFKESLFNGRCGLTALEGMEQFGQLTVHVAGQVKDFNPIELGMDSGSARRSDRFSQFGICAAIEAMRQSGLTADENIIASADYVINIGPGAGRLGGQVVYQGSPKEYVDNLVKLPVPKIRRKWNNYIEIKGATENNLKNLNVKFPLGVMTVVTGVSGSGKSTLVKNLFYGAVKRYRGDAVEHVGSFGSIEGSLSLIGGIELVDQNPIGKSSRSNPCIYLKAFDEIRNLFAEQQLARQMGYTASYFSFNYFIIF